MSLLSADMRDLAGRADTEPRERAHLLAGAQVLDEVARQSKAMCILDGQIGRWQSRAEQAEAEVARLREALDDYESSAAFGMYGRKAIEALKTELACPLCGCATPEDAQAAECGCDGPVCERDAGKTLAEHYAAAHEALERGRDVARNLLAAIGEVVSQFHAAEADERLPAEVRKVVGGWAVLLAKALTLDRAALAKPEQEVKP